MLQFDYKIFSEGWFNQSWDLDMFGSSFVLILSKRSGPQKFWLVPITNPVIWPQKKAYQGVVSLNNAIKQHGHRGFVACHIPQGWHQTFWSIPWNLGQLKGGRTWALDIHICPGKVFRFRVPYVFWGPNTSGCVWMSRVEINMENAAHSDMKFQ